MDRIWYVDDDEASFALNERDLRREFPDAEIRAFTTCEEALEAGDDARPDVVVLDEHFGNSAMQGRELLPLLRARWRRVAILMITANPTVDLAVSTMRMGATDFLLKPFVTRELLDCIHRAFAARRIDRRAEALEEGPPRTDAAFEGLVGTTELMRDLIRRAETVARTDATVLITGETGTGKGLLAKYIHARGKRASGPFVNANLAAATGELVESLLFGHERGAFTGAFEKRRGKFDLAAEGTIFLDEIGELAPAAQMKLLRVLQDGTFEPVGSSKPQESTARVLAATNQDLPKRIEEGLFREDLYYRLNV
ncbi:MAG: sigma-54-dependent Fis family transcriptional regulator, partial [Myxococcales bacterium]|nr:sigma-54-dependent Fis family transcriptional regulator [Myxococcales bacterium]